MYITPDFSIPFEDRGALMGFKLLPVSEKDYDEMESYAITSEKKWRPYQFREKMEADSHSSSDFSIGVNASFKQPSKGSSTTLSDEDKKPAASNTKQEETHESIKEEDTKPRAIEPQARIPEEVSLQDNRQQISELQGSAGEAMNIPPIEPVARMPSPQLSTDEEENPGVSSSYPYGQ